MRCGVAKGETSFCHDAVFYRTDQEFLGIVASFLEEGAASGEPTMAALPRHHAAMVRSALPSTAGITFIPSALHYARPAATIKADQELFASHVAAGADHIRVVGEVPHPGVGEPWDGWARYEAAVNCAFAAFPLWGLCAYDLRTTPAEVVDDVVRTHPHITTVDGVRFDNDRYEDPAEFLAGRPRAEPDPLESRPPGLELVHPRPAAARHALAELSRDSGVGAAELDDLIVAASEVVTNAILHGRAPATFRAWAGAEHIVVTVHDRGPGPSDPMVGLIPTDKGDGDGGYGLWIAHQLCSRVTLDTDADGFTVRLVAGAAPR
jgi:anti-sigma regulatory factor (Ser/Thr protein kinase)